MRQRIAAHHARHTDSQDRRRRAASSRSGGESGCAKVRPQYSSPIGVMRLELANWHASSFVIDTLTYDHSLACVRATDCISKTRLTKFLVASCVGKR